MPDRGLRPWPLAAAVVAFCLGAVGVLRPSGFAIQGAPPVHATQATESILDAQPGFVGAETCGTCHADEYTAWAGSTHGRAGGPPNDESVIAPFDGTPIAFADATVTPSSLDGVYAFRVERADLPAVEYRVDGVIGRGHMVGGGTQGFVSEFDDGTVRFLPFDWSRTEGRWFCNTARIAGWWTPGGERDRSRLDLGWVPITSEMRLADCGDWPPIRVLGTDLRFANCQGCHASQVTVSRAPQSGGFETRMTSLAINCESCHGPGAEHVALARSGAWEEAADPMIGQLGMLDEDGSVDVCLQCHALKRALQTGYLPGDPFEEYYSVLMPLISDDPFFPDGRIRTFGYQLNHRSSACYLDGSMTCVDCHAPHDQSYQTPTAVPLSDRFSDGQCLECHASKAAEPAAHTRHADGSDGARCVSCHMPYLQQPELGEDIRYARSDHTIPVPRPAGDQSMGITDACALCHADRSAAELDRLTAQMWGELKPRRPEVAGLIAATAEHGPSPSGSEPWLDPTSRDAVSLVAGIKHLVTVHLGPDMDELDPALQAGLVSLVAHPDVDVQSVALAALHMARGTDPPVRGLLTRTLEGLGPRQEAVVRRWVAALRFMADRYRASGEPVDALAVFNKVLEINPVDAATLLDMGALFADLGDAETAIDFYQRSLDADPDQSVTWVNAGLALETLGDLEQAASAYQTAVGIYRWEALAHMNLGNLRLAAADAAGAVDRYRLAIEADPGLVQAHYYLALAQIQLDRPDDAVQALRSALALSPDHAEARALLDRLILEGSDSP